MKHFTAAIVTSVVLAACGGGGGGSVGSVLGADSHVVVVGAAPPVHDTAPSGAVPCQVDYWGDSIGALTAPLLDPRIAVTQHVVIGGTAAAALAAFLQAPLAPIVVIEYGTNDANAGSDLLAPVTSMLARAAALGDRPVLTGIPKEQTGQLGVETDYDLFLSTQGVPYANWPAVPYAGPTDTMPDGVHPEAAYAQRLATALSTTLLEICTP